MRKNRTELVVIDYEYTSLGSREYDLANIFSELMLDNAYPFYPFIISYPENCLTEEEFKTYARHYLQHEYTEAGIEGEETCEEYVEKELPMFLENLYCSMILDGYYWGVWSLLMIDMDKINDKIFNFGYITNRIKINEFLMSLDFVREAVENKTRLYKESKEQ